MHDADRLNLMTQAAKTFQGVVDHDLDPAVDELKRRSVDAVAEAYDRGYKNGINDEKSRHV